MPSKQDKELVVALDIGTSKIVAIVGEVQDDGELEVIGFGSHPSRGLKKGVVVNIESTVHSIQRAVEEHIAGGSWDGGHVFEQGPVIRRERKHGVAAEFARRGCRFVKAHHDDLRLGGDREKESQGGDVELRRHAVLRSRRAGRLLAM